MSTGRYALRSNASRSDVPSPRQSGRNSDGFVQAPRVGQTFPGDVEGRAMIHRGAHYGQAKSEVYAGVEREHFEGNVALVVIEGDDGIETFALAGGESGVGRQRTIHRQSSARPGPHSLQNARVRHRRKPHSWPAH